VINVQVNAAGAFDYDSGQALPPARVQRLVIWRRTRLGLANFLRFRCMDSHATQRIIYMIALLQEMAKLHDLFLNHVRAIVHGFAIHVSPVFTADGVLNVNCNALIKPSNCHVKSRVS
jgi:hypothetical protein